jgi:acetyl esterase
MTSFIVDGPASRCRVGHRGLVVAGLLCCLALTVACGAKPPPAELVFKEAGGRQLRVFLDFPPDWRAGDRRPAVVFFHGGGFRQGDPTHFAAQGRYLADRGMVVVRPEYRLIPRDGVAHPDCVEDAVSAMRWVRRHAQSFGIDPDRIAAGGGSAGGYLAAALATTDPEQLAALGYVGEEDDPAVSPRPDALLLYNPGFDAFDPTSPMPFESMVAELGLDPSNMEPVYHLINPMEHLDAKLPPTLLMYGSRDAYYPQQLRWTIRCREAGVPITYHAYKGEVHGWFVNPPHFEYTTRNVDRFLQTIGWLGESPQAEMPAKKLADNTASIRARYTAKKDWDDEEEYRRLADEHGIELTSPPISGARGLE